MDLGALGFWMFIAAVSIAGIWGQIRKRDTKHETLRRLIENGQSIDAKTLNKLVSASAENDDLARDLKVGGVVTGCIAPGLLIFGWIMSNAVKPEMFAIMGAVAVIVTFVSIGLLMASRSVSSRDHKRAGRHHDADDI